VPSGWLGLPAVFAILVGACDAYVRLAVVASAAALAVGADIANPLIGLAITFVILRISCQSWHTVRSPRHR
jgi:hypothetical protein